jgi:enoyl-CoA hydratase
MIRVEQVGDVAVVRLEHGKVNTLDVELLEELADVVDDLTASALAIVITGNGRVFSAGADLKRVLEGGADYVAAFIPALHRAFLTLFRCRKPTVAAVEGAAIAGGCIITAACDHRLMADGPGRIGANELLVGVPFPAAAIEVMHHACGHRTGDLVLRARLLDVDEAVAAELIHEAVPPEHLVERAVEVATELAALPSEAYAMAKQHLRHDSIARIERDSPVVDPTVARIWAAEETLARISAQLERVKASR